MKCPLCGKEMKQISIDTFSLENPMVMTEEQRCECGVIYQYSNGAERYIKNGEEINLDL